MTRHQRNATASSVYTYHERKKDQKASGYGTLDERLGKDSVKNFDCCSLTLQPCREPVVTPDGFLYDKEAILENILHQKREVARKLKEYERQKDSDKREFEELAQAAQESKAKKFIAQESTPARPNSQTDDDSEVASGSSVSNIVGEKRKHLPSFWVPSLTESAKRSKIEKPDNKVYCPMSGRPLKLKDLIPVKFALAADQDSSSNNFSKDRYVCAVTKDILTNSIPCAVLKKSGYVVTVDCLENIIKKDWIDPMINETMKESDVIYLQRGGTGFASTNEKLKAKLARPVMELQ